MRGEMLLEKMELAAPKYVNAADKTYGKTSIYVRLVAVAACVTLMVVLGVQLFSPQNLPMITLPDESYGMGFEVYAAYDISEMVNGNPWEDSVIRKLPVYKNAVTYNEFQYPLSGVDVAAMEAMLCEVAARFGVDTDSLSITNDAPDAETRKQMEEQFSMAGVPITEDSFAARRVMAEANGMSFEVYLDMTVTVRLENAFALPVEFHFTDSESSYKELQAVAEYLRDTYKNIIGLNEPLIDVAGGDYDMEGKQHYTVSFYEGKGNAVATLLGYHFDRVTFYSDGAGGCDMIRFFAPDLSQKVGEYPIITVEEATRLLLAGNYITTVQKEMPGSAYIANVELVYRHDTYDAYYIPYYRFYVELPDYTKDVLKTYGTYYVPAIDETYISNMPLWDGQFN